jgi:hypothetical protein
MRVLVPAGIGTQEKSPRTRPMFLRKRSPLPNWCRRRCNSSMSGSRRPLGAGEASAWIANPAARPAPAAIRSEDVGYRRVIVSNCARHAAKEAGEVFIGYGVEILWVTCLLPNRAHHQRCASFFWTSHPSARRDAADDARCLRLCRFARHRAHFHPGRCPSFRRLRGHHLIAAKQRLTSARKNKRSMRAGIVVAFGDSEWRGRGIVARGLPVV